MNEQELEILNGLLNKYERTECGKNGQAPIRPVYLKLYGSSKKDLEYDVTNSKSKNSIHQAAESLEKRGVLKICWYGHAEKNTIIEKLVLNQERLEETYGLCKRKPVYQVMNDLLEALNDTLSELPENDWAWLYIQDMIAQVQEKRTIPSALKPDNHNLDEWFSCITYAAALKTSVTERVFSMNFADSKSFEKHYRNKLASVIKRYLGLDLSTEEALSLIGIVRYPENITMAGPVRFFRDGNLILDGSSLNNGFSISCEDFWQLKSDLRDVRQIISIENKANYLEYIKQNRQPGELVIYHGGQVSPRRMKCFQMIRKEALSVSWKHWSDIDYGGFLMLARLRENVDSAITPWRMDIESIKMLHDHDSSISFQYACKLKSLSKRDSLKDFAATMDYICSHRVRLEQEAFLVGTARN